MRPVPGRKVRRQAGALEAVGEAGRGADLAVPRLRVRVEVATEVDDLVDVRSEQRHQIC